MARRFFCRLHWQTWLVVSVLVGSLGWCQVYGRAAFFATSRGQAYGWPFSILHVWVDGRWDHRWEPLPIGLNLVAAAVLAAATVFVVERWIRDPWRFQIASLLRLTAVLLVMVEIGESWHFHRGTYKFIPLSRLPIALSVPILLALGCTIYAAGWLAARPAGRLYKLATGRRKRNPGPE